VTRTDSGYLCCFPKGESCWIVVWHYVNLRGEKKKANKETQTNKQKIQSPLSPPKNPNPTSTEEEPTLKIKRILTSYDLSGDMGYPTSTETKVKAKSS